MTRSKNREQRFIALVLEAFMLCLLRRSVR